VQLRLHFIHGLITPKLGQNLPLSMILRRIFCPSMAQLKIRFSRSFFFAFFESDFPARRSIPENGVFFLSDSSMLSMNLKALSMFFAYPLAVWMISARSSLFPLSFRLAFAMSNFLANGLISAILSSSSVAVYI